MQGEIKEPSSLKPSSLDRLLRPRMRLHPRFSIEETRLWSTWVKWWQQTITSKALDINCTPEPRENQQCTDKNHKPFNPRISQVENASGGSLADAKLALKCYARRKNQHKYARTQKKHMISLLPKQSYSLSKAGVSMVST